MGAARLHRRCRRMEPGIAMRHAASRKSQSGFSLLETMIAMSILSVGALGMAGVFTQGMQKTTSSPGEVTATQKAAEAIESVFSARDSHSITWDQLRNESSGGFFKNGPQPLTIAGPDGVVNTHDDGPVESVDLPGPDQQLGTFDDVTKILTGFTREIAITDLSVDLRSITVTITYSASGQTRTYVLTALISTFA
jgi:prepilin-type N-terminal cleavage/methylation domain-containing protein